MPVLDHPTHESTRIGQDHRYGCHNRPRVRKTYPAKAGSYPYATYWIDVANRMSVECRYDMSLTDPCCTDCKWRGSGESYNQQIRSKEL